jgi:membrane-associated phospholipid phosphatase
MSSRVAGLINFLKARLSRDSHYGLQLTVGVLLLLGATSLFGVVAGEVLTDDHPTLTDVQVSVWLQAHHWQALIVLLLFITRVHSVAGVSVLTIAFWLYLRRQGQRGWLIILPITVFGGMLLNVLLKSLFHQGRPVFEDPVLAFSGYGFPSGHTMAATCFYGAVAAFVTSRTRVWSGQVLVLTLAGFMILLVGFSRVYLGAHYLSDVLGAMMEGLAWVALCLTAASTTGRARRDRRGTHSA